MSVGVKCVMLELNSLMYITALFGDISLQGAKHGTKYENLSFDNISKTSCRRRFQFHYNLFLLVRHEYM